MGPKIFPNSFRLKVYCTIKNIFPQAEKQGKQSLKPVQKSKKKRACQKAGPLLFPEENFWVL